MIVFISKKNYEKVSFANHGIEVASTLDPLIKFLQGQREVGFDTEASSLDAYEASPLLCQFGNTDIQYVLDATSYDLKEIEPYLSGTILIGHNLKYDYKILKVQGVTFRNMYDTMIAEEIITNGSGLRVGLDAVVQRRLDLPPLAKDVRETFAGHPPEKLFSPKQILYAAEDTQHLIPLKEKQMIFIEKYGYHRDLYEIEFPLIPIIGDAELEGFKIDEDEWRKLIKENQDLADKQVGIMTQYLIDLQGTYPGLKRLRLNPDAKTQRMEQLNMFGDPMLITSKNKSVMNFNSGDQLRSVFEATGNPIPTIKKKDPKLGKKVTKVSFGEDALIQWQISNPNSKLYEFIDELIKYKKALKAVSSFGERFLYSTLRRKGAKAQRGYKSPYTGKVHTIYRQCGTDTTRMASGDADNGYYNSQNIPKDKRVRQAFIADPGYVISTCDLSGAELRIAASLSGDKRLIELMRGDDLHSPIATFCYNRVLDYIVTNMNETRAEKEIYDLLKADPRLLNITEVEANAISHERLAYYLDNKEFQITDKTAYDIRTKYKNVNFGLIYGASAERIMEILGVAKAFATIIEQGMREYLPDLFRFLDMNSQMGVQNGYVRFNTINGGRHWFKEALDHFNAGTDIPFNIKGDIERACKNYPIQGTQGHMIKEATVRYFYDYVYPNNYDVRMKLQVHDELVIMHRLEELEHGEVLKEYMNKYANKYLSHGLTMDASLQTLPYWTK